MAEGQVSASKYIVNAIMDYLKACPLLKDGAFRFDALGDTPVEYTVDMETYDNVVLPYVDGTKIMRLQAMFGSREAYDLDRLQNMANIAFYEDFANWIEEQNEARNFPALPERCVPDAIQTLGPGYLFNEDGRTARYQIPIECTYTKYTPAAYARMKGAKKA